MSELIKAIAVTAELMGTDWSESAARVVAEELAQYPLESVKVSLSRCRKELKSKLSLMDILDRIPGGHPGPEEAWATIAKAMKNETLSLIWTDEMREAYGVANGVSDDPVQARMAFKETYSKAVAEARATRKPLNWTLSKGTDKAMLELVLTEGVKAGKLTAAYAKRQLPYLDLSEGEAVRVIQSVSPRLLSERIGG